VTDAGGEWRSTSCPKACAAPSAATEKFRSSLTSRTGQMQRRQDERSWKIGPNGLLVWAHHARESAEQILGKDSGTNKIKDLGSVFSFRPSIFSKTAIGKPMGSSGQIGDG
jgi:hypothetical protein